ncbi:MAG TPA: hypothetical protein VI386_29730 [Candidatus Sulfotelmatobacter sp.]
MIGEVTAFLALGLLDRTGLFELKPPFLLKHKQEFPNCAALLNEENVGRFPTDCSTRYVNLCRLTGLAWVVWIGIITLASGLGAFIIYHSIKFPSSGVFEAMGSHPGMLLGLASISSQAYEVTCLAVWGAMATFAVFMTIYYSILLSSCRESEEMLKSALTKPCKLAAAS